MDEETKMIDKKAIPLAYAMMVLAVLAIGICIIAIFIAFLCLAQSY